MQVPFLNLELHHEPIRNDLYAAIDSVIASGAFAGGPFVAEFERAFADFCGTRYASGVGSGTEALSFALLALGVGAGDEVITVPSTFMATAEAISFCGAKPIFVDIDEDTYTMDPAQLESAITPRTKAIVPVHLFGLVADMDAIMAVANKHSLPVVEDACQAHGAEYKDRRAGSLGHIGCFSFYPGKNLGALGEAGAIVTDDSELKCKIDALRDHGQTRRYHHAMIGWNGRMDGIQAAALSVKLPRLAELNSKRRQHASQYSAELAGLDEIILPTAPSHGLHAFHIYAIRAPRRDGLLRYLAQREITAAVHYPVPVHLQPAYASLGFKPGAFPVAERCADEFLSMPMFPELTPAQIQWVAESVRSWVGTSSVALA
jgi:dTDP-4-amino-4,6-dideoxygalactose transaminase